MFKTTTFTLAAVIAAGLCANPAVRANSTQPEDAMNLSKTESTDFPSTIALEINGKTRAVLLLRGVPRPALNPVYGPYGLVMTRLYPMEERAHEKHDHTHHNGLWYAHGDVNGYDFWIKEDIKVTTCAVATSDGACSVKMHCDWTTHQGETICTDRRAITLRDEGEDLIIDYEIELIASHGDVVFGDTKEGTMALRLAPQLRHRGEAATGAILNSEGQSNDDAWGKRANWVDDWGEIDGKTVGAAIFDHPDNPIHPTWWHARDYGLFAANPFGVHDFEKKPEGTGDYKLLSGHSLHFRYRFIFHVGDAQTARIAERYQAYTQE
ncbi:PmoA family protein [Candidatus Sumerlaeota bacterium]|nr:PmoA family protein [Candidatus Sumerlaeota bacterium]